MNWEGKTVTCSVIRGFVKATPVVERCTQQPLCISRLVIAPQFVPGQEKSDPDHGLRVCVNALVNKCLKPYGSTILLAIDEIKKLHGYKYYLGVDGSAQIGAFRSARKARGSQLFTPLMEYIVGTDL